MEPSSQIPKTVAEWLQYGALAGFGGMANYLYLNVLRGKKFVWAMFSANIFIAFFVGSLIGRSLPIDTAYRDGFIMAGGYCAFPILTALEIVVREWVMKHFRALFGIK